jgi:uncharacterized membrane protein
MAWFKPTTLLDKFYEIGIIFKGIDGLLELLGGILLLVLQPGTILNITKSLTQNELSQNPHSFIAQHIAHAGVQLAQGHNTFAVAFLITHGAVKVGLVACLLLNKLWAYPLGIVVLTLLLLVQLYQLIVGPTFGMAFLTVLDVIIIWLIGREWQQVKKRQANQPAASND